MRQGTESEGQCSNGPWRIYTGLQLWRTSKYGDLKEPDW